MKPQDLSTETKLIQLSEEASELIQAALKLVRVYRGETPVPEYEAKAHLLEEIADVLVCVFALDPDMLAVEAIARHKSRRWEGRIRTTEDDS